MENAIYDPRTTRVVNGQVVRDPFPEQRHPARACSTRSRCGSRRSFPRPDNGELLNNWSPAIDNHRYQMIPTVKIDHNIGAATRLSGYWSAQFTDQITAPDGFPVPITSRRDQKIYGHTVRLNLDKYAQAEPAAARRRGLPALPQPGQLAR